MRQIMTGLAGPRPATRPEALSGPAGLRPARPGQAPAAEAAALDARLPPGVTRWRLIAAARGAALTLGLSGPMLRLLEHYVDLSRDADWEAGTEPVIPVPLCEVAEALGRGERQIRNIERRLAEAGLLSWRDSGNHHRKGRRCGRTGRLIWAYGPSLAPMRARAAEILAAAAGAREARAEARRLRLAVSALRRQLAAELCAWDGAGRDALSRRFEAVPDRAPAGTPLAELRARRAELVALRARLAAGLGEAGGTGQAGEAGQAGGCGPISGQAEIPATRTPETHPENSMNGSPGTGVATAAAAAAAPRGGEGIRPGDRKPGMAQPPARRDASPSATDAGRLRAPSPDQPSGIGGRTAAWGAMRARSGLDTSGAHGAAPAGWRRPPGVALSPPLAAAASSEGPAIAAGPGRGWADLADAAQRLAPQLGVGQADWAAACGAGGRRMAALCLFLTERGMARAPGGTPAPVAHPARYFRSLVARARAGRLDLLPGLGLLAERGGR